MSSQKTNARDAILNRLRTAVADPQSLFRSHEDAHRTSSAPSAVTKADASGVALASMFGERLEEVLGSFEIVENAADLAPRIVAQIECWRKENGGEESYGRELLSWTPDELPIRNLSTQLDQHGVALYVPDELTDKAQRAHAATLSVGLTGVDAAFAGTGTMVLFAGHGKSRAASLLPLHHIALVPMTKIHATLESWLATLRRDGKLEELFRDHAQVAFITGPSKSADIELNLTLGVHGPRDVHAIVFDDGA